MGRILALSVIALCIIAVLIAFVIPILPCMLNCPPCPAITITFAYSTEKEGWIKDAMDQYNRGNPQLTGADGKKRCIHIEQSSVRGSVDMVNQILDGKDADQPTIWSPASSLELHLLSTEWSAKHPGANIITYVGDDAPQSLVYSPLVFAVWQQRASALTARYTNIDWPTLAMALQAGWPKIRGNSDQSWGLDVKFGHTQPNHSNSGLLTLTLMAYASIGQQSGLTPAYINSPAFHDYFKKFEDKVYCFGASSEPFIKKAIAVGPGQYDVISTYENLVLANDDDAQQHWKQPLQMFYPNFNIISDHPLAILQGQWVTKEQKQGAQDFRKFLLDKPMQELALTYGFRPTNNNVHLTDQVNIPGRPGNLFLRFKYSDIKMDIQPLAQPPSGQVVKALIDLWAGMYDGDKSCAA